LLLGLLPCAFSAAALVAVGQVWGDGETHAAAAASAAAASATATAAGEGYDDLACDPVAAALRGSWCARVRRGGGRRNRSGNATPPLPPGTSSTSSGSDGDEAEAGDGDEASGVSRAELRRTLEVFRSTLVRLGPVSLRDAHHHIYVVEDRHSEV